MSQQPLRPPPVIADGMYEFCYTVWMENQWSMVRSSFALMHILGTLAVKNNLRHLFGLMSNPGVFSSKALFKDAYGPYAEISWETLWTDPSWMEFPGVIDALLMFEILLSLMQLLSTLP